MATTCPLCEKGTLQINAEKTLVHCSLQKTEKQGNEFVEVGECSFKIFLDQSKFFGKKLSVAEIKKLATGEGVKNAKGDTMFFDKERDPYFTRIEYSEKKPSTDI